MRSRLLASVLLLALAGSARGDAQIAAAMRALRSDSSLKVRAQAAIILGQRGAREAVGALADAARNDSSEAVRLAAVSALAKIGDPAGKGAIEAALRDDDQRVRAAAERAMLAFAGPGRSRRDRGPDRGGHGQGGWRAPGRVPQRAGAPPEGAAVQRRRARAA